ncbi:hypothetical protein BCR43DRAFT_526666 [Syncephalastrum racemosum]|uniref:Uncharacterized protein n=1 Tax=Syncephalastrum racemosum TaxID=13706 RepID=A0A1X2H3P7_SYNRA|nr:hypothetical protein BCR43DRAFT_526666 [Syncephalastrum racemosum]
MSDLNWCTYCDNAVSAFSDSLYCSEQCLRADALRNHPLLGYTYQEFTDFPRPYSKSTSSTTSSSDASSSPNTPTASPSLPPSLSYTVNTSPSSSSRTSPVLTAITACAASPPKLDLHECITRSSHVTSNKKTIPHTTMMTTPIAAAAAQHKP